MASTLKDSVLHWRKKLERTTDENTVLNVIHKLSKVPITLDLLQDTGIGKVVRGLAKKPGKVGTKASSVLHNWREVVASAQKFPEIPPKSDHTKHSKREKSSSEGIAVEKSRKEYTSSYERHRKSKHLLDSDHKQKLFTDEHSKHLSQKKTVKKSNTFLNGISKDSTSACVDDNDKYESSSDCKEEDIQLNSKNTAWDKNDSDSEKSQFLNGSLTGKRKVIEVQSPKVQNSLIDTKKLKSSHSVSHSSRSKNEMGKHSSHNSDKKREKEKNCGSSDQNANNKHLSSNSDNISSKSHGAEKSHSKKSKKSKVSEKKDHSEIKTSIKIKPTEAFTSSEVTFEDCLGFNDIVPVKKKKSSKTISEKKGKNVSISKKSIGEAPREKSKVTEKYASISRSQNEDTKIEPVQVLQLPVPTLSEVDLFSTLPPTLPNYRPLPQRNYDCLPSKKKVLSNEEAIAFTSSRREKTAVYSGRKKDIFFTEVPSLFDSCIRILIDNIDAIEYMGEVPYFLLKQVLERCTAGQLYTIEDYNPYLLEDTHELWEIHCKKDFRTHKPQENETWRDLYWRASEEREKKLKSITANISLSMIKSKPVRQVKLAYVDSVVKPPREIVRKQAKNGTALPVNHIIKAGPPSKATPRPTAPAINSAAASSSREREFIPKKPKVAPLMAKTLKSMKQCFRR